MRKAIVMVLLLAGAVWAGSATQPGAPDKPPAMVLRVYDVRDYLRGFSDYPLHPAPPRKPTTRPGPRDQFSSIGPGVAAIGAGDQIGSTQDRVDGLVRLIESIAAPDSWCDVGGIGSITELDGKIYVMQPPEVQAKVASLIAVVTADADRTVHVSAEWLTLTDGELAEMREPADHDVGTRIGDQAMQKANPAARTHLLCLDGQTVHITTDAGRIRLQIHPQVTADGKHAILDVLNSVADGPEFQTTARIPLGENIVIGGITAERPATDQSKELYLVIRVDAGQ